MKDKAYVFRALNKAIAESKGIGIHLNGDSGKVTIKVGTEVIAKYTDVYEAITILLPEFAKELT